MAPASMPATIATGFQGSAQIFEDVKKGQGLLILAAVVTMYIVLGILYESTIHPVTILSTLPSAGVGALLALIIFRSELTVIAFIGIILLIGIVKKNGIMMVDFAVEAERKEGKGPEEAIYQACLLRFRPIMMTTMAALLGGLPLALGTGVGSELRSPLGIAIVGGLIFSQMLTFLAVLLAWVFFLAPDLGSALEALVGGDDRISVTAREVDRGGRGVHEVPAGIHGLDRQGPDLHLLLAARRQRLEPVHPAPRGLREGAAAGEMQRAC